jgi:hypothetical protein
VASSTVGQLQPGLFGALHLKRGSTATPAHTQAYSIIEFNPAYRFKHTTNAQRNLAGCFVLVACAIREWEVGGRGKLINRLYVLYPRVLPLGLLRFLLLLLEIPPQLLLL